MRRQRAPGLASISPRCTVSPASTEWPRHHICSEISPVEAEGSSSTHIYYANLAVAVAFAVVESCIVVLVERYKCRTTLPTCRAFHLLALFLLSSVPASNNTSTHLHRAEMILDDLAMPPRPWLLYAFPWMPYPCRVIIYLREKMHSFICGQDFVVPDLHSIVSTPPEHPPRPARSHAILEVPPSGHLNNQPPIYKYPLVECDHEFPR